MTGDVLSSEYHSLKRRTMLIATVLFFLAVRGPDVLGLIYSRADQIFPGPLFQFVLVGLFIWLALDCVLLWLEWEAQGGAYLFRTRSDGKAVDDAIQELIPQLVAGVDQTKEPVAQLSRAASELAEISRNQPGILKEPGEWFATTSEMRVAVDVKRFDELFDMWVAEGNIVGDDISMIRATLHDAISEAVQPAARDKALELVSRLARDHNVAPLSDAILAAASSMTSQSPQLAALIADIKGERAARTNADRMRVYGFHVLMPLALAGIAAAHFLGNVFAAWGHPTFPSAPDVLVKEPVIFWAVFAIIVGLAIRMSRRAMGGNDS